MILIVIKKIQVTINIIAILLLFTTSYTKIANSDENVGGWLDFQLLMKKKAAEPLIRKICQIVDDRGQDLEGEICFVKNGFFKGKKIGLFLQGGSSFFASNAPVVAITIRTDYGPNFFNSLRGRLANRWNISESYRCTKPTSDGYKKCGISFNSNRIQLSHLQHSRYGISSMRLAYLSWENLPIILD